MIPRAFEVHVPLERGFVRNVLFAVELLDAVTLERISRDVRVTAEGLEGKPIVNGSGFFVWLEEDFERLRKLVIDPGRAPYVSVERAKADVKKPLTSIELMPRLEYSFPSGITGLLGSLIEQAPPRPQIPIANAEVWLQWSSLDGRHDASTVCQTDANGDFVTFIRFSPTDEALLMNENNSLTVRLRVRRDKTDLRTSSELQLPLGRIAEPSTFPKGIDALIFAWDELQP